VEPVARLEVIFVLGLLLAGRLLLLLLLLLL